MHLVPRPLRETERLKVVSEIGILERVVPYQVDFLLTALRRELKIKAALVTIIGDRLQHVLAFSGLNPGVLKRDDAFWSYAILQDTPTVIEDTTKDDRVRYHPCVVQAPHIRFYAGVPLQTIDGHNLGAVVVVDDAPRTFSTAEETRLREVASIVAIKLGLYDNAADLARFTIEDLGRLIRLEAERDNSKRLIALIEEFYKRSDIREQPPSLRSVEMGLI